MDNIRLEEANKISKKISELEFAIKEMNKYKGSDSDFLVISAEGDRTEIFDKDIKDLVKELIVFELTQKLNKLKEEFKNL